MLLNYLGFDSMLSVTEMMVSSGYDVEVKKRPAGRCVNFRDAFYKLFFLEEVIDVCLLSSDAIKQCSAVEEVQVKMETWNRCG